MLANGDRRDCFVVVDQAGGQHALNKKLTGQTLAETRARLADLDRGQLPSVEQAQEIQRAGWRRKRSRNARHSRNSCRGGNRRHASAAQQDRTPEPAAEPADRSPPAPHSGPRTGCRARTGGNRRSGG